MDVDNNSGEVLPKTYPTVVHMLLDAAAHAPMREALVCGDERLSYIEYLRCVLGFARQLQGLGVHGERVGFIMGNSIDICIAYFAAHLAGAQVTPLNPVYTENELGPMLQDAEVKVLLHDEMNAARDEKLGKDLGIPHRIAVGPGTERLTRWAGDRGQDIPDELPGPDELAMLQFTGGTTGRAKGANLKHSAVAVNIAQREAMLPLRLDQERMLGVMPLFHCYAVSMSLHAMVYCRGALILLPKYHPQDALATFVAERISIFAGSPTLFTGLMNYSTFEMTDFSRLHMSTSGSAPLPEEMLKRWEATTGTPIIEGYGMSEAGPVISFNPAAGVRKPGSVGKPVPRTRLQIVDLKHGETVLAAGENGEIRIRGPQVMDGYRNRREETAVSLRDGWLYTGDIGMLDEEGYLFITGRKKEMIICSGYNVFPREVEEVLHRHSQIREAAVVGKADEYRGEIPIAFVTYREGAVLAADELAKFCGAHLAAYKIPVEFRVVPALPKTTVGKIDKIALAKVAAGGHELARKSTAT